ncbi:hypothetical protein CPC735_046720 [Coccidioides posadasii C735 delta SOWgp]|uniref:Uncharacterized protein n=1 Tax=Coccidioides posadasii (strain C735) TaxID=222929 RepID=C5PFH4_COCP7|nr:hypothetical protein CPC735_046720 [Coccidioides posadasii C735 delta SOWgp]EER23302.1 hypothetical protein CPC735_046720 [Coccidioides posadasii C735 delta SOWgp]|eukprot:XP_003065447.1 hypothetical protein CPC735_046720 [Coccidioides posadasii C735 delta SOWgp]
MLELVAGVKEVPPVRLFELAQALQPDRRFPAPNTSYLGNNCIDPLGPIARTGSVNRDTKPQWSSAFILPAEIVMIILEHASAESVISFFHSSKEAQSLIIPFCRYNPWHFYPSIKPTSTEDDAWTVINAIAYECSADDLRSLNRKWKMIADLKSLTKYVSKPHERDIQLLTLSAGGFLLKVPHPFGLKRLVADVPSDIKAIEVHITIVCGDDYICGIGWKSASGDTFLGYKSKFRRWLHCQSRECNKLRFIVDPRGLRSLKLPGSEWSCGNPENIKGWEGMSLQRSAKICVVLDQLKFRQITWSHSGDVSFDETMLMGGKHGSKFGTLSEQYYVRASPQEAENVRRYGSFCVEAITLDENLHGITMYDSGINSGISGVRAYFPESSQCIGLETGFDMHFLINGPAEVVSELDIRLTETAHSSQKLSITVRRYTYYEIYIVNYSHYVPR